MYSLALISWSEMCKSHAVERNFDKQTNQKPNQTTATTTTNPPNPTTLSNIFSHRRIDFYILVFPDV